MIPTATRDRRSRRRSLRLSATCRHLNYCYAAVALPLFDDSYAGVIAQRACALRDPERVRVGRPIISDECDGCRYCLINFECPAMLYDEANERVVIDERICNECGQCVYACHKGFITV